jgi:hypothetical protein
MKYNSGNILSEHVFTYNTATRLQFLDQVFERFTRIGHVVREFSFVCQRSDV